MCGRFALTSPPDVVRDWFAYDDRPNFPPRYNIAPTQPVAVVREDRGERRFGLMRWGLLPGWLKELKGFPLLFNVRSETAAEKGASRGALRYRRAVVPADAFYEWQRPTSGETRRGPGQAFLMRRPDRAPLALAAIWETWLGADGSEIDTVAILTGAAPAGLAGIHPRCPLVLEREALGAWFDPGADATEVEAMMAPTADGVLEAVAIGPAVNRVAADDPSVQEPVREEAPVRREPRKPGSDAQGSLF